MPFWDSSIYGQFEYTDIYFGLKASGNSYNANTEGLTTFGIGADSSQMDIDGGITPNVGAGVYFRNRKLYLSLLVPKILKPRRLERDGGLAKLGRNKLHTCTLWPPMTLRSAKD